MHTLSPPNDPAGRLRRAQLRLNGQNSEDAGEGSFVHMALEEVDPVPEFPVDVFPASLQQYIEEGAEAINVPVDMIAVPLLGFAAGAIGNTRAVEVKPGWIERPNLWLAVIGDPGSGKSPANDYARAPLDSLQREAMKRHQEELAEWEQKRSIIKKNDVDSLPPPPVLDHYFTTDTTMEALTAILSTSPGVAVVRDELVGWVKSHDAYRKGGDRQAYLSLWAGAPLKVDRRGTGTHYVAEPVVPIIGGIQPDMLSELGEEANRRDGFVERMLMAWPVARPIRWNEVTLDPRAARATESVFKHLRLPADVTRGVVLLSTNARTTFKSWYEENGRIIESSQGIARGCYAKYPGQLARIALILHALHHPRGLNSDIDEGTVSDAIRVIEYFRGQLVRVLPHFGGIGTTKTAGLDARIERILGKADDWVARKELSRGLGNSVKAADISEALTRLEREGRVENRTVYTGSRPRQESRLTPRANESMNNADNSISLEGDAGDDRFTR